MKPYARQCGGSPPELSTQSHAGRASLGMSGRSKSGSEIKDKTQHCESRPGAKEKIRNAKRSFKKRARQQLKRETQNAASDVIHPTFRCIAMGDHNLGQDNRILPDYHST